MGPGSPCSVGCQMCLDFFLPLLKPCLSAASLFRLGVFTGVPVGWMGGLYRSVPGWRGAQQRRVHLHPGQDPVAGVMSQLAVLPDFVSLPVSGTLGFPPFHGQLHSWHDGVKSTCTLQPMAMRSAFAASPDWRTHTVGGRRADAASA